MKYWTEIVVAAIASVSIALGAAADDAPDLAPTQSAKMASPVESPEPFNLHATAIKKFDAGADLSAEEYRSLEAGCVGFESHHNFFDDISTITVVYQDSPAYKAGIRAGDKIVAPEKVEDAKFEANPTISRQKVKCGKAGTPVDVTVLRDGKPEKLTLFRMNIEDIQEPAYRHNWEQILHRLGYPQGGDFSGTTLKTLTPTE